MSTTRAYKVHVDDVPQVEGLRSEDGWVNMRVQFLIDEEKAGARLHVFGKTVFPPGGKHDWHRHPNAEEFQLLVEGEGIVMSGDEEIPVRSGEVVFTPVNEWHGFRNTSDTEDAVLLWGWAGAASREAAGYQVRET